MKNALNLPLRMRRMRASDAHRRMIRETRLSPDRLIYPLFAVHGEGVRRPIESMPGCAQLSPDLLVEEASELVSLGIPAALLFGVSERKDAVGSESRDPHGAVQEALRALKKECPSLLLIADVCLCAYTDHGHCGMLNEHGVVENDPTAALLAETAVSHAQAGADMLAPSDMMDGRVGAIRSALDAAEYAHLPIMSYAAKYASAFYGPFREAANSAPQFGDRRSYQMDPPNVREALREMELDIQEGADIVMVKPAMPYLDVIRAARGRFETPIAAYQVSGEYAMIKAAARQGWLDEQAAALESLTGIARAGADMIITYFAKDAARLL